MLLIKFIICSIKTIKTPERRQLIWTYFTPFFSASIVEFEQVNVSSVHDIPDSLKKGSKKLNPALLAVEILLEV